MSGDAGPNLSPFLSSYHGSGLLLRVTSLPSPYGIATMQALGGYKHGKMLFLGLGTGLGSAMVVDGIVERIELVTSRTGSAPLKTMLGSLDASAWDRRNGNRRSET